MTGSDQVVGVACVWNHSVIGGAHIGLDQKNVQRLVRLKALVRDNRAGEASAHDNVVEVSELMLLCSWKWAILREVLPLGT